MTANISHLCLHFILQLANMSNGLSGKLEREEASQTPWAVNEEISARTRNDGGGSR